MDQNLTQNKQKVACKIPVIILLFVFLLCMVLAFLTRFTYFGWDENNNLWLRIVFPTSFEEFATLLVRLILDVVFLLLNVSPAVLMLWYLFKRMKPKFIVPMAYIIMGVLPVFNIIYNTVYYCTIWGYDVGFFLEEYVLEGAIHYLMLSPWCSSPMTPDHLMVASLFLLIILTFILTTIKRIKYSYRKIFLVVASVSGILLNVFSMFQLSDLSFILREEYYLYSFLFDLPRILASLSIYIALMLFGLKNEISPHKSKKKFRLPEEKELVLLKDKLELGIITEEEYQAQREEIINKL